MIRLGGEVLGKLISSRRLVKTEENRFRFHSINLGEERRSRSKGGEGSWTKEGNVFMAGQPPETYGDVMHGGTTAAADQSGGFLPVDSFFSFQLLSSNTYPPVGEKHSHREYRPISVTPSLPALCRPWFL